MPKCLYVEFFATCGKAARKRRKKGLCAPTSGDGIATSSNDGFPHLAGELSTLVSMALAAVHLSDWGVVQKCTLQPCTLVCITNKPSPPLLGERRHKWRQSIRRGIAPGGCSFELYAHQTGCHFERHTVAAAEMPCFRLFDCRRQTIFKRGKMPTARIAGHTACHKPPRVSCLETPRALSRYKTPKE